MGIDTREVSRLAIDLAAVPAEVRPKASLALGKTAHDIERDGKILAPVDTGALVNSISSDIEEFHAEIGPTVDYAHFVEEGTSRMAPQPYMRPAFDRNSPGLAQAIAKIGGDIL